MKNYGEYNYTDYKLGVTKDVGSGVTLAAAIIGNSAKTAFYTGVDGGGLSTPTNTKNLRTETLVLTVTKAF